MIGQNRIQTFTLGRLPFWVFMAAGASGITLAPLFQSWAAAGAVLAMSFAVIFTSLAARFRDVGLSAWLAPLGLFPAVTLFVGLKPRKDVNVRNTGDGQQFINTVMFTLMISGTWIALLVN